MSEVCRAGRRWPHELPGGWRPGPRSGRALGRLCRPEDCLNAQSSTDLAAILQIYGVPRGGVEPGPGPRRGHRGWLGPVPRRVVGLRRRVRCGCRGWRSWLSALLAGCQGPPGMTITR